MLVIDSKIEASYMSEARWPFWIFLLTLPCRLLCRSTATAAFSGLKLPLSVLVCSTNSVNRLWTHSLWWQSHSSENEQSKRKLTFLTILLVLEFWSVNQKKGGIIYKTPTLGLWAAAYYSCVLANAQARKDYWWCTPCDTSAEQDEAALNLSDV